MNNKDKLKKRLADYEKKVTAARIAGNFAEFQKWDYEIGIIKALISMEKPHGIKTKNSKSLRI